MIGIWSPPEVTNMLTHHCIITSHDITKIAKKIIKISYFWHFRETKCRVDANNNHLVGCCVRSTRREAT